MHSGDSVPQAGLCGVQTGKLSRGPRLSKGKQRCIQVTPWARAPSFPSLSHCTRQGRRRPWCPLALAESRLLRRAEAPAETGSCPRRDTNLATPASRSASLDFGVFTLKCMRSGGFTKSLKIPSNSKMQWFCVSAFLGTIPRGRALRAEYRRTETGLSHQRVERRAVRTPAQRPSPRPQKVPGSWHDSRGRHPPPG